jgi:nucleoside-diphosphate-sugar epimerase
VRVLVTGATGFVGSHVAEALVARDLEVVASVRATSDLRWLAGLPVARRELDLATPRGLEALCRGIDVVVHAGGITRAAAAADYRRINAEGTRALLLAAAAAGVGRCVLISSLAARGPDGAPGPTSAYGRSKLEAEHVAAALTSSLAVVALRVAGVYGPRDTDLLPLFRLARRGALILPLPSGKLQPVFAADVAELVVRLLEAPIGFGPWPVAEPRAYGWGELAALLGDAVGRRVRVLHAPRAVFLTAAMASESAAALLGGPPTLDRRRALDITDSYTCDVSATEAASGWRARTPLQEGLERTVRWYRERAWL